MRRITSIVVATDLSPRSDRAVGRAIELSRRLAAKLTIVHAIDSNLGKSAISSLRQSAWASIEGQIATISGRVQSKPVVRVEIGRDFEVILRVAKRVSAELIVLGLHKRRPFADLFIGSTIERVARFGRRPVLVVKEPVKERYRSVLAASDFSECSRYAIEFARGLVPDGVFRLVHAYHAPSLGLLWDRQGRKQATAAHERGLAEGLREVWGSTGTGRASKARLESPIVREDAVPDLISRESRTGKVDLLVLGTAGRTGLAQAFVGSIASAFLNNPPCDVLAVPVVQDVHISVRR